MPRRNLESRVSSAYDLLNLALDEGDTTLEESLRSELEAMTAEIRDREFQLTLSGEYDARNAILAVHAGAAARNPRTGPTCSCGCSCDGRSAGATRARSWTCRRESIRGSRATSSA